MVLRLLVEGGGDDLPLDSTLEIRNLLRPFVDQDRYKVDIRMVLRDRVGDFLEHYRFAGFGLGDDDAPRSQAYRREEVDQAGGSVLGVAFQEQAMVGIDWRKGLERDSVPALVRWTVVNRFYFDHARIAFAVTRRADVSANHVSRAQAKFLNLRHGDIDVVGAHMESPLPDEAVVAIGDDIEHTFLKVRLVEVALH